MKVPTSLNDVKSGDQIIIVNPFVQDHGRYTMAEVDIVTDDRIHIIGSYTTYIKKTGQVYGDLDNLNRIEVTTQSRLDTMTILKRAYVASVSVETESSRDMMLMHRSCLGDGDNEFIIDYTTDIGRTQVMVYSDTISGAIRWVEYCYSGTRNITGRLA